MSIELSKYVDEHGQTETARRTGLTQGAIWQMLRAGRKVYVTDEENGFATLEERRPIRPRARVESLPAG